MAIEYRPYQHNAVSDAAAAVASGKRKIIINAPTGSGKTLMACLMIQRAVAKKKRVLFLAAARELIRQSSNKLREAGVHHGIIMAGHGYTRSLVQVASVQTIMSRAVRDTKITLPDADLIFVDECHQGLTKGFLGLLGHYEHAVICGLSATPARKNGRQLGDYYEAIIPSAKKSELIRDGYLVPCTVYGWKPPSFKGVRVVGGDYVEPELAQRMNQPKLIGDALTHWKKLAEGRPTVAFCVSVAHSLALTAQFRAAGVPWEHVDGTTTSEEREDIFGRFKDGKVTGLSSCNVLHTGVDFPWASCGLLCRPTKSFVLYVQMAGRLLRPFPGKSDALILDHAGCVTAFGFPDEDVEWELTSSERIQDVVRKKLKKGDLKNPVHCPQCGFTFEGTNRCPRCGHVIPPRQYAKMVHNKDAALRLLRKSEEAKPAAARKNLLEQAWHYSLAIAARRQPGTVAHAARIFHRQTSTWPWDVRPPLPNLPPSQDFGRPVVELFPQYVRRKAGAGQDQLFP